MKGWLLHMTEAQRIYAVDLIDAVLQALVTMSHVRTMRSPSWSRLTIHGFTGRRPAVSATVSRGSVFLRTPLSPRRGRFAAELTGPACASVDAELGGDVAVVIGTLAEWRFALTSPVTDATRAHVEGIAASVTGLLRGAVHAHRPDWELASLQSSRNDGHVLRVYNRKPDGRQLGRRFTNRPGVRGDGGMTPELAGELDRIVGDQDHAHVVELAAWRRFRLSFDGTPDYCVSPTSDPMVMLRALGALPPGARLTTDA